MKGRGVRVINPDELRAVTPDAKAKTHFLEIVMFMRSVKSRVLFDMRR